MMDYKISLSVLNIHLKYFIWWSILIYLSGPFYQDLILNFFHQWKINYTSSFM